MAAMIRGITVTLYERTPNGTDEFNYPIYTETPVAVENVLVSPVNTTDIVNDLQLYGKRAEYELCIPKGDAHAWENSRVEFFGKTWQTFGFAQELIENMAPLDWNRKVKVHRYG